MHVPAKDRPNPAGAIVLDSARRCKMQDTCHMYYCVCVCVCVYVLARRGKLSIVRTQLVAAAPPLRLSASLLPPCLHSQTAWVPGFVPVENLNSLAAAARLVMHIRSDQARYFMNFSSWLSSERWGSCRKKCTALAESVEIWLDWIHEIASSLIDDFIKYNRTKGTFDLMPSGLSSSSSHFYWTELIPVGFKRSFCAGPHS